MVFTILLALSGLILSAVAIYYSVIGLTAIFAAAFWPIVVMGTTLEVSKLVAASWLKAYWTKIPGFMKLYMTTAVLVLMFITSMGIFGFLSKAHIDQTASVGDNGLQIQLIDQKISREQKRISDADLVISQLDKSVQILLDANRIRGQNGAIATRESQKTERESLNKIINEAQTEIAKLQDEKLVLEKGQLALEAEVGPIKYIAEFVYGTEADKNLLEEAVRWVILILIFVFDPLAILMLLGAQMTYKWHKEKQQELKYPEPEENTYVHGPWPFMVDENENVERVKEPEPENVVEEIKEPEPVVEEIKEKSAPVEPTVTVEAWNKMIEAAEAELAKEEEDFNIDDLDVDESERAAMRIWKAENPGATIKRAKKQLELGRITELPWKKYIEPKKKSTYIIKDQNQQITKTKED
jgi:hypothetical protein